MTARLVSGQECIQNPLGVIRPTLVNQLGVEKCGEVKYAPTIAKIFEVYERQTGLIMQMEVAGIEISVANAIRGSNPGKRIRDSLQAWRDLQ